MKKITVFFLVAILLGGLAITVSGEDIQRGGTLVITGREVGRIDDPARYSWVANSNPTRLVAEYLTYTDEENITHPWLLKDWEASEDLLTWTLYCREGILFSNGDEFTADDVVFNIKRWLDPEVGSSILGLMGSYLSPDGIEKVNKYTVTLHLDKPSIAVPQHLYHYPAQIMNHRTFEGDFIKAPVGTGPFVLEEYSPGERVVLANRSTATREDGSHYPDYWKNGADGKPLPYLDQIIYLDMGEEPSAHVAALQAGKVDFITEARLAHYLSLRDNPNVQIIGKPSAQGRTIGMRVDKEPWDDNVVRTALKLCIDEEKMLNAAYYGQGVPGGAFHVCPVHPAYCEIEPLPFDPQKAKQMLEEAGYDIPIKVEFSVGSGWEDAVSIAQILKQDAAPAFDITINTMPITAYWDIWTECDFGVTPWTHRPLGTMVLGLAYTCDKEGNPVPWNETRWCDEEFSNLLEEAKKTLDTEERREIMCKLEKIQQERGSMEVPYWRNVWHIGSNKLQNMKWHPTQYEDFLRWSWLKQE
jgi:peptide/nickel transport system substrate-binding protein